MKRASITYTKNNLSRLIGMVKEGESVLVVDRKTPVARITPVGHSDLAYEDSLQTLVTEGVVVAPNRALDVEGFLARPKACADGSESAVSALLAEREEAR
jgi:antitoxin (DNA-binding transcriptional repressor) of toxin-antitoxin stability system